jgi:dihydrodipicolinate synthase/N-acetylneuraminate lyase
VTEPTDPARFPRVILPTVCVPWTDRWELDEDRFRAAVRERLAGGIRHLYVFGTAGEGYAVSDGQFDRVVSAFASETVGRPGVAAMVGLINQSTTTMIGRVERVLALGIRDFQVSLPAWGTLADGEVRTFFRTLLPRFPEARFLHYNLMRTGRLVGADLYAELASEHPNLVGTKNGTSDVAFIRALLVRAPMLRHFLTEVGYPFGCSVGRPGLLMSLSSTNLAAAERFFQAGLDGDLGTLLAMQADYIAMLDGLLRAKGATDAHMDGAYEKLMHRVVDPGFPVRLLPPYAAVADEAADAFRAWLARELPGLMPDAG